MMDGKIGTLSPGKKADIVMLRADDINMAPVYDPVYSIVEIAGAGNVDTVIIDGIVRKQNGKLTFPADVWLAACGAGGIRRPHHARRGLQGGDRAGMTKTLTGDHDHDDSLTRRAALTGLSALAAGSGVCPGAAAPSP